MSRYVIQVGETYIKWASILSNEGVVSIREVGYTANLMDSRVFGDSDKKEDLEAWENFYNSKHGDKFEYKEIDFKIK
ncbi:hypothetical protein [Paenibacillus dendritiformis]|uniref:hypothetical protein n=1 Tax=Paenibacillus dendritiformis TaxID=130049 RepID=UPI00387E18B3